MIVVGRSDNLLLSDFVVDLSALFKEQCLPHYHSELI